MLTDYTPSKNTPKEANTLNHRRFGLLYLKNTQLCIECEQMELNSEKPETAKEGIIHTLSTRFPLTAKQLTHTLQRERGMALTYQAVHKALQELEKEGTLTKTSNQWQINSAWLAQQATFIRRT